jgi:hypothetical protein
MSDQGSDGDQVAQRRDALPWRLLKTPPQSHAEAAEKAQRAKEKATWTHGKRGFAKAME